MYEDTEEEQYGCFECGEMNGDFDYIGSDGRAVCTECGKAGIIGLQEALDILLDLKRKGVWEYE